MKVNNFGSSHKSNSAIAFGFLIVFLLLVVNVSTANAQTTEFTFQSRLLDNNLPPTANYDFEFRLFDIGSGGAALATNQRLAVAVADGVFTVLLDFGAQFTGANRWLEISVRTAGNPGGFQQLLPRQRVNSTPYSMRSLNSANADNATNASTATNATQLGGVSPNQYVRTTDPRMTDDRNPLPNSPSYIRNSAGQQASSNFNVSGTGTANSFNAATQYNIGGSRVLSVGGTFNIFAGIGAGTSNSSGNSNSFFGHLAGQSNSTGSNNSFYGATAGFNNTSGGDNSFFGRAAGGANTTGADNSFFGYSSGQLNTTGSSNAFLGSLSGQANTTGTNNSFFGRSAGFSNNTGNDNSFFGRAAGGTNTTGSANSFFGNSSGISNTTGGSNAFFGNNAGGANSTGSFNSFYGTSAGILNTTGGANSFFGNAAGSSNTIGGANAFFGNSAGGANTTGTDNAFFGRSSGFSNTTGGNNSFVGRNAGRANITGSNNTIIGNDADVNSGDLNFATAIGAGAVALQDNSITLGRNDGSDIVYVRGALHVGSLLGGTLDQVCYNTFPPGGTRIGLCSSAIRYKSNINNFTPGLNLIKRLRPVSFNWIESGKPDLGLVAEEVAEIEPLLTTTNKNGEIEGVKYDRVGVVLINAVNEQQAQIQNLETQLQTQNAQIQKQNEMNERQQALIEAMRKIICQNDNKPEICKEN